RAVRRRYDQAKGAPPEVLRAGPIELHPATRFVTLSGEAIVLTEIEFDILELLMRSAGRAVSRDEIAAVLYQRECSPYARASIDHRFTIEFFEGSMKLQLQQAQKIYGGCGPGRLAEYLEETDAALTGKRYLTDAGGRDLVSGVDRSNYLPTGFDLLGFAKQKDGQEIMVRPSLDGQYHLVVTAPPPLRFGSFLPYF